MTLRRFEIWTENGQPLPVESGTGGWVRHADAQMEINDLQKRVDNACRIMLFPIIYRYLLSHSDGRWDGSEKAQRHREMIQFYLAMQAGISDPEEIDVTDAGYKRLHDATRVVTDHLDEVIGFPLMGKPDYDRLVPLFFEAFHRIVCSLAQEQNESHLDSLQDVVTTACRSDSNGISAYADALRTLAQHGRCRIIKDQGKRVIVEWISAESPTTIGSGS